MRFDFEHFWPRYGMAVALFYEGKRLDQVQAWDDKAIAKMMTRAIKKELGYVMLYTRNLPAVEEALSFEWLSRDELNPGKVMDGKKQNAANGFYLAPHVATSNNAADIVKNARALLKTLQGDKLNLDQPTQLLRSFSPLVSKINNGRSSMGNPRAPLAEAAASMIASLAHLKPGVYAEGSNHVIVPDLPLLDDDGSTNHEPLVEFIRLFQDIWMNQEGRYETKRREEKKAKSVSYGYRRPPFFSGNYAGAPWDATLGPLGVLAAIGIWAREAEIFLGEPRGAFAERTLHYLTANPLYVVSYDGKRQLERLGHHLVRMAMQAKYALPRLVASLGRAHLYHSDRQNEALFRLMVARFIQSFEPAAFRRFMAFRATYDAAFTHILEDYFMEKTMADLPVERRKAIVQSARVFGAALNWAAYKAAEDEVGKDEKRGKALRTRDEYKARKLVVLESAALSAKSHGDLMQQLCTRMGRETGRDMWPEAGPYMDAVFEMEITLDEAQQLAVAYMRLRSQRQAETNREKDGQASVERDSDVSDLVHDEMPADPSDT